MGISAEDTRVLAAVFGEEVATKISGAVTDELSLGLRLNGKLLSPEEQAAIKETAVKQGKELGYKEIAKNLEIQLEAGEKDPNIIAEKFKSTLTNIFEEKYKSRTPTEEQIALAKKASEYEEKNKKLLETLTVKEREAGEWQEKFTKKEREVYEETLNNKILSAFPEKMNQDKSDALLITRSNIAFETTEDGKIVAKSGGKLITDALGEPESIDNVVKSFVEKKGWIKTAGMGGGERGGGGSTPAGMTPEQARAYMIQKGIDRTSPEGLKLFAQLIKK